MSENCVSCKTWTRFEAKQKDGSGFKLRMQDLPVDRKDDAIDFLINNYMNEEAFQVAAGIHKSEDAIQEYRSLLKNMFEDPKTSVVLCCVDEPNVVGNILGLSIMGLEESTEKLKDFIEGLDLKTEEMKRLFHILIVLEDYTDAKEFKTYYGGRGIAVHRDYRGLGLANEFVRVRKIICIEHKIPMTCAWMTAIGTQKAAEKNNWKTLLEISLEKMEIITGFSFIKKVSSFKLMFTTID
ncbi:jg18991 [Pararge aegeria aegeria]|uniref:Jg18991 protein n=1 Tax=Pararge aegeria aegeria TaxID=348720 RepID=A0A8S4RDN6_9NEOP|nr:jg18991 [Pararge aegeria aegeria]